MLIGVGDDGVRSIQMSALAFAATQLPALDKRPLPNSEFDYVDWSWRRWREINSNVRTRCRGYSAAGSGPKALAKQ